MTDPLADNRGPEDEDRAYFMLRAAQERARAENSEDVGAALSHRQMAEAYEARAAALSENSGLSRDVRSRRP